MCGIVGIASAYGNGFSQNEANAFSDMLFLDSLRGIDSTGVFSVDKHSNVDILKEASHAYEFLQHTKYKEFRSTLIKDRVFAVGHNRAATRGKVEDKNAHPFHVDDKIVLVQNGTYRGDHRHLKDTEVDTEAVAHVIAETPDIEEALRKINAAYAFSWFNTETKTLYLIRNNERPLYLLSSVGGTLLFGSEHWMLTVAALRNNITCQNKPMELPVHTLVSLKLKGNTWEREDKKLDCYFRAPHNKDSYTYLEEEPWYFGERMFPQNNQHYLPAQSKAPRTNDADKSYVKRSVVDILANDFPDVHIPRKEGLEIVECLGGSKSKEIIEVCDYIPSNDSKTCSTWHIFGNLVKADNDSNEQKVVCHWFLYDKTEKEAKEYANKVWYEGEIQSISSMICNDKHMVIACLMKSVQDVSTTLNITAVQ